MVWKRLHQAFHRPLRYSCQARLVSTSLQAYNSTTNSLRYRLLRSIFQLRSQRCQRIRLKRVTLHSCSDRNWNRSSGSCWDDRGRPDLQISKEEEETGSARCSCMEWSWRQWRTSTLWLTGEGRRGSYGAGQGCGIVRNDT
jgi:hypothetical protein